MTHRPRRFTFAQISPPKALRPSRLALAPEARQKACASAPNLKTVPPHATSPESKPFHPVNARAQPLDFKRSGNLSTVDTSPSSCRLLPKDAQ